MVLPTWAQVYLPSRPLSGYSLQVGEDVLKTQGMEFEPEDLIFGFYGRNVRSAP
jgi:hypothetical protein